MPPTEMKVLALYGTRPELIKLAPVLEALQLDGGFRLVVVSTSQHREMIDGLLPPLAVQPDFDLDVLKPDQTLTEMAGRALLRLDPILRHDPPDLFLVQGDTSSAFIGALAAFYFRIPVGHIEAGLRSFDKSHPFPEEVNRRLISTVADLHFAPLASNEQNLLAEGVDPESIFVTGNTVVDALRDIGGGEDQTIGEYVPTELLRGRRLVLVTAHRRESFDGPLSELCHGLRELADAYPDVLVVYPVHLNPRVREQVEPILGNHERIRLLDPLPYATFVDAMRKSHLIVTDSGGVQEEAPALGKPVLVFRRVTERNEGLAAASARLVGLERGGLVQEARRLLDDEAARQEMIGAGSVYGDGRAADRIVEALHHHFRGGARPEPFTPAATAAREHDEATQRLG